VSVCLVHCGKTADQIWIWFEMVGRMSPGMRHVVGFGNRSMGRGNFGGECEAPHHNQWGVCGVVAPSQISLGFLVLTTQIAIYLIYLT